MLFLAAVGLIGLAICYEAPLISAREDVAIPHRYIVQLRGRKECSLEHHFKTIGVTKNDVYFRNISDHVPQIHAYAGYFPQPELAKIRSDRCVVQVSSDTLAETPQVDHGHRTREHRARKHGAHEPHGHASFTRRAENYLAVSKRWLRWALVQMFEPWNFIMISAMGRVDYEPTIMTGLNAEDRVYNFSSIAGSGVFVFVFDRYFDHFIDELPGRFNWVNFKGRVGEDEETAIERTLRLPEEVYIRQWLHGPCIATVIGGANLGVAKEAHVIGVGIKSIWNVIEEILTVAQWHISQADAAKRNPQLNYKGSIISISLYFYDPTSHFAFAQATKAAEDVGILIIISAGNDGRQILPSDPRHAWICLSPGVLCIGAVDMFYSRPSFSNFGAPVHLWAPGADVPCTDPLGSWRFASGTSFAVPHVAGVAAIMQAQAVEDDKSMLDDTLRLKNLLMGNAQINLLSDIGPTRNLLLNSGINQVDITAELPFKDISINDGLDRERQAFPTHDHPRPVDLIRDFKINCFEPGSPRALPLDHYKALWLRARWERGHANGFEPKGEYQNIVPCYFESCIQIWDEDYGEELRWFHDMTWAVMVLNVIFARCVDEARFRVGGYVEWLGMGGVYIYLHNTTQPLPADDNSDDGSQAMEISDDSDAMQVNE